MPPFFQLSHFRGPIGQMDLRVGGHSCTGFAARTSMLYIIVLDFYIQLYSPEYTLAENIYINSTIQNKDRNVLIHIVQLKIRYTFVKVLTKDITEDSLGKFPHEFRTPFQ